MLGSRRNARASSCEASARVRGKIAPCGVPIAHGFAPLSTMATARKVSA